MFINYIKNLSDHRYDVIMEIKMAKNNNKKLAMYGAGMRAEMRTCFLKKYGIDVDIYCVDNQYFKPDQEFMGRQVHRYEDIKDNPDYVFLIAFPDAIRAIEVIKNNPATSMWYIDDLYDHYKMDLEYVLENEQRFSESYDMMQDELSRRVFIAFINGKLFDEPLELCKLRNNDKYQYDYELLGLSDDEVIVDCGAYIGDTINDILSFTKGKYKKIIAFEPDESNCCKMIENIPSENVTIVKKGAWNCNDVLKFYSDKLASSSFSEYDNGNIADYINDEYNYVSVPVTSIDEIASSDKISFIKMDIEGSELKALEGAAETIKKYYPKLAICVYHRADDFINIPQYINSFSNDKIRYKLYMRHHARWMGETVLYAIPESVSGDINE